MQELALCVSRHKLQVHGVQRGREEPAPGASFPMPATIQVMRGCALVHWSVPVSGACLRGHAAHPFVLFISCHTGDQSIVALRALLLIRATKLGSFPLRGIFDSWLFTHFDSFLYHL